MSHIENDLYGSPSDRALLRVLASFPEVTMPESHWQPTEGEESCPEAGVYLLVARGGMDEDEAEELLSHASTCPLCGVVLARSVRFLEGNPSPEEAAAIAQLAASTEGWQRALSRELAGTRPARRPLAGLTGHSVGSGNTGVGAAVRALWEMGVASVARRQKWVLGTAIAAGVVLASGAFLFLREVRTPEHELAAAYTQARTLELRVPGAAFAVLTAGSHTRGGLAELEPASLLEARASLARELERSPEDAHWLELQARADILEERYNSAADVLDRLIAQGSVTSNLLLDAATAYYQRGLVSGSELDRSTALDYLKRADELAPTDPVVLFNEALVMEDRGQMMNAVEVWNRYITVERDSKWSDEGKRKLAALEKTLTRLKGHQSRIDRQLETPEAMDALAGDAHRLASLDEELSSYQLAPLLEMAYPRANGSTISNSQSARGSPCSPSCRAARRLLKAVGRSLELEHHDFWLTDLLPTDIDTLPQEASSQYARAIGLLAQAMREDYTGLPVKGEENAVLARKIFGDLGSDSVANVRIAARVGTERAAVEELVALQYQVNFDDCLGKAARLHADARTQSDFNRYVWMHTVALITEAVCDDTAETRRVGQSRLDDAEATAAGAKYLWLDARIQLRRAGRAQDAGDDEAAERITQTTLRAMVAADAPTLRLVYALNVLAYAEHDSPRPRVYELCLQELDDWDELVGFRSDAAVVHLDLARAEIRIGSLPEAERQLRLAKAEGEAASRGKGGMVDFSEAEIFLADSLLERSDATGAERHLDKASANMAHYSDSWGLRTYAAARGQLALALGHLDVAARTLESEIRSSEGRKIREGDQVAGAEYAELDHDLYAELAATWLAQGRSPASVLALWERFRLRSRGLPLCGGDALDCEQSSLLAVQHRLGKDILTGQVVLLDRVLVYRMEQSGISWSQQPLQRQNLLAEAQRLERAVASPHTSNETAAELGRKLSTVLLPQLPEQLAAHASVLIEADPLLQNLPWTVLPTGSGPLGLQYPLAELRSILVPVLDHPDTGRGLVIGASLAPDGEPPLPEALEEARSVSGLLRGQPGGHGRDQLRTPELLLGDEATRANVAHYLGTASTFHFAGHAVSTRYGTELLLASSSPSEASPWINGAFLRQHPPRACRLAVLSACATGAHDSSWNHPLQDMVETLGELGVPEVVGTRWQIDSEASVSLMDTFYQSLAGGSSVAMALRSARRVQSDQSLYKNPYYWGAYYVTGREATHLEGALHASLSTSQ